jgi:hypothetical protein
MAEVEEVELRDDPVARAVFDVLVSGQYRSPEAVANEVALRMVPDAPPSPSVVQEAVAEYLGTAGHSGVANVLATWAKDPVQARRIGDALLEELVRATEHLAEVIESGKLLLDEVDFEVPNEEVVEGLLTLISPNVGWDTHEAVTINSVSTYVRMMQALKQRGTMAITKHLAGVRAIDGLFADVGAPLHEIPVDRVTQALRGLR